MNILNLLNLMSPSSRACAGFLVALICSTATGVAQCGKDVVLTSSRTEYLNAAGIVQRSVDEKCVIKIGKTEVSIAPADHEPMIATVASTVCEWKETFKLGKTTVQAKFKDRDGKEGDATITIEGKDGKITCVMTQKERPDRVIKVFVDQFEEQKADSKQ